MVTLVVATTIDPASIGPASALLAMPGWHPGPFVQDIPSFVNGEVRLLKHDNSIVKEDNLDKRWEDATGEVADEVIFLSRHTAVSNRPALTVHPIGVPHLGEDETPPSGGKPGWAGPPNPRIGPWLRLLKTIAETHNLIPEFEVTLEATHHGPVVNTPTMFVEIGSTEEYWKRQDAAQVIALLLWEGLALGGRSGVGNWNRKGVWVGHLLSGYSLPMEDPSDIKVGNRTNDIGGTWKQAIKVSFEATQSAFPGGEILAHLDNKSFKSWQKNAITSFLAEQNIKIGRPGDFY
ncbi:D-aminoacyl-tRNA deacylase isoform X2 [Tasmannia lanceolata]|uniref:D-aminoacyl-tRNA deacylase isoform X2 n=1 Tax=Tasmannia lanceolata TaxID=3420 RepID=UPI004064770C